MGTSAKLGTHRKLIDRTTCTVMLAPKVQPEPHQVYGTVNIGTDVFALFALPGPAKAMQVPIRINWSNGDILMINYFQSDLQHSHSIKDQVVIKFRDLN